jgi:hypothetical protein
MYLARYSYIFITLLLMTLTGQVIASPSEACQGNACGTPSQVQTTETAPMDHAQHMEMNSTHCLDTSDCGQCCDCTPSGCLAAVLPASQTLLTPKHPLSISHHTTQAKSPIKNSLYRPPIFR